MIYVVVLLSTKWQVDYFHSVEAVWASFCHLFQSIKTTTMDQMKAVLLSRPKHLHFCPCIVNWR